MLMKDLVVRRFSLAFVITLVIALISLLLVGPAVSALPSPTPLPGFDPASPLPSGFAAPDFEFGSAQDVLDLPAPPDFKNSPAEYQAYLRYIRRLGSKSYTPGSAAHFYSRWNAYQAGGGKSSFQKYRAKYVTMTDNRQRGLAFEEFVREQEKTLFSGSGWQFGQPVGGTGVGEKPDAYSNSEPDFYEFKSGSDLRVKQLAGLVVIAKATNKTLVYLFQQPPSNQALTAIAKANQALPENAGLTSNQSLNRAVVVARYYPATPVAVPIPEDGRAPPRPDWGPPPSGGAGIASDGNPLTGPGGGAGVLAAPNQHTADGGLSAALANSPDSAADAAEDAELTRAIAAQDAEEFGTDYDPDDATETPGGVDFSTLQLRYVADTHQGDAAQFAFSADAAPADQPSYGGRRAAQLASDAFFVWLELPTSSFTVNLNPDEPDRIIDDEFGRTDAGRVLLEADLQMKKTTAKIIDPDTPLGRQFWDSLRGGSNKCLSARSWIVPGTATVHDTGHELYILDAPLTVKTESQYLADTGANWSSSCSQDADSEYNEELFRTTVVPLVEQQINEAPEYADLRRVYFSRIAAQWYRDRGATKHTVYSDLIDRGDISRWQTTENWTPEDTYARYLTSYRDGEFHRSYTTTQGDYIETQTYIFGGVDFSSITENSLSGATFLDQHQTLPQTVNSALDGPTTDRQGNNIWFGGLTADRPISDLPPTVPSPATSKPAFYVLSAIPVLAWLVAGVWLLVHRRRTLVRTGT